MRTYSPLTLAYIGDGIYDIIIRSIVVDRANTSANRLHKHTSSMVKAETQARMIELLEEHLSQEEADIYRRGRNAKSYTTAKNASVADYRKATGFEAVMGYLYLKDDIKRAIELVKLGAQLLDLKL
ncbi:MAG: ribonuclease III domain-containing protein [Agathobacter sp.]|nr:ribonuclease III domain-containing protein [Agathobacter sp.]